MDADKIAQQARALYSAHGDKAEAEAAQKAREHEAAGNYEVARDWQAIRAAIREIRGPHES